MFATQGLILRWRRRVGLNLGADAEYFQSQRIGSEICRGLTGEVRVQLLHEGIASASGPLRDGGHEAFSGRLQSGQPLCVRIARHGEPVGAHVVGRSEEHTSELQSLMRISSAVFCLKKKKKNT